MTRAGEEIAIPVNLRRGEMGRWLVSKWVEASLESPREQDRVSVNESEGCEKREGGGSLGGRIIFGFMACSPGGRRREMLVVSAGWRMRMADGGLRLTCVVH